MLFVLAAALIVVVLVEVVVVVVVVVIAEIAAVVAVVVERGRARGFAFAGSLFGVTGSSHPFVVFVGLAL